MTNTKPPELCENCGYSKRHSRQKPGEVPVYCGTCRHWMCEGCLESRECAKRGHRFTETPMVTGLLKVVPGNDGIYGRIPDVVYHGDPNSLSSSGARLLTPPSVPALYRAAQDLRTEEQREVENRIYKRAFDFGHAAHKMVLGEGSDLFMLDPAVHGVTQEGKKSNAPASCGKWIAAAKSARNEGRIPLAKSEIQKAQRMAGVVYQNPLASKLLADGDAEVSLYWHDDATGVRCRARPDYLPDRPGRMICVDYKTARSAAPKDFEKSAGEYGYHQQVAFYQDAIRELGIDDDPAFIFIVQEKIEPFLMSLVQLDPDHVELGRRQNRRALELFARCQSDNRWPGYGDGIHDGRLPGYVVKRIEESLDDEISTLT